MPEELENIASRTSDIINKSFAEKGIADLVPSFDVSSVNNCPAVKQFTVCTP